MPGWISVAQIIYVRQTGNPDILAGKGFMLKENTLDIFVAKDFPQIILWSEGYWLTLLHLTKPGCVFLWRAPHFLAEQFPHRDIKVLSWCTCCMCTHMFLALSQ